MKALVLQALLFSVLCIVLARMLILYFGLDVGALDWGIVGGLIVALIMVYGVIRA